MEVLFSGTVLIPATRSIQLSPLFLFSFLPFKIYTVSQKTSRLWLAITLTYVHGF